MKAFGIRTCWCSTVNRNGLPFAKQLKRVGRVGRKISYCKVQLDSQSRLGLGAAYQRRESVAKGKAGLWFVVAVAFMSGFIKYALREPRDPDAIFDNPAAVKTAIEEMNAEVPIEIDAETEITQVELEDNAIVFHVRLIKLAVEDIDVAAAYSKMRNATKNYFCSPETGDGFLRNGYTLQYVFRDRDGAKVTSFRLRPGDCRANSF